MAKVTIVLPVFNGARYLSDAIDSCLRQTFQDIEIIIVDDGSNDATPGILASQCDPRLRVFRHNRNMGLPAALNTGFAHASGKYLTWTSHDNRYAPTALQVMHDFMESNANIGLVYSDYWIIDEQDRVLHGVTVPEPEAIVGYNCIGSSFMYTRQAYEAVGKYEDAFRLAEDYDYWIRIWKLFTIAPVHQALYYHRWHRTSLSSTVGLHGVARVLRAVQHTRLFADSSVGPAFRAQVALSTALDYALVGDWVEATKWLTTARDIAPSLFDEDGEFTQSITLYLFANFSDSERAAGNAVDLIEALFRLVPSWARPGSRARHALLGQERLTQAYAAYAGRNLRGMRLALVNAILCQPAYLFKRSVFSLLFKSLTNARG